MYRTHRLHPAHGPSHNAAQEAWKTRTSTMLAALGGFAPVAVVPHGCGVYGYYMAMAFSHIPLAEFMMMSEHADKIEPNFGTVFKNEPLPKDGCFVAVVVFLRC